MQKVTAALVCSALIGVGCTAELSPFGEAIVIVDTDAPVPKLVNTLRVDFFRADGTWFQALDVRGLEPDAWPVSFSVFSEDEANARAVVLRLRASPEEKVRDYRGERFHERPSGAPSDPVIDPEPPIDAEPRLVRDGVDVTPETEPLPSFAIDRLVRIELAPGSVGGVALVLRAACAGTMANLASGESCADSEGTREPLATLVAGSEPGPSLVGTAFVPEPCAVERRGADRAPLYDEAVCVPGGMFFLGDLRSTAPFAAYRPAPERIAVIPTLFVDTYEVTVARWRAALARGFTAPMGGPTANDDDLPLASSSRDPINRRCTWSYTRLVRYPRESYPLNCVLPADARAFCQHLGGDLLTEAQWEYAAAAAGRESESGFPWGNDAPSCDAVVYARNDDPLLGGVECAAHGYGAQPVTAGPGDVTPVHGIRGLGGNVHEWVVDDFLAYGTVCWAAQPLADPRCVDPSAPSVAERGGSYLGVFPVHVRHSAAKTAHHVAIGFRCASAVAP